MRRIDVSSPRLVLALILAAYLLTLGSMPREGFWINDNGCKFIQARGLVENGFQDASIPWPGRSLDPALAFNPLPEPFGTVVDGALYGLFSYPFAALSGLLYAVAGANGLYVIPLVSVALLLWGVSALALRMPGRPRRLAMLITALCTPVWFYGVTFWEHLPAIALAVWAVEFVLRHRDQGRRRSLWAAGVCLAASIYFRDELYLLFVPLAGTVVVGRRDGRALAAFAIALVVGLLPLWAFNQIAFGHLLGPRLAVGSSLSDGLGSHLGDRFAVLRALVLNGHESLALSLVATGPLLGLLIVRPRISTAKLDLVTWLAGLTALAGGAIVLAGHLTAERPVWWLLRSNGLFAASPILVYGLLRTSSRPGGLDAVRPLGWILLAYTGLYVFLAPLDRSTGLHWGCRYLLVAYPLLAVLAASFLAQTMASGRKVPTRALVLGLALLSLGLQLRSLDLLRQRKSFSRELHEVVSSSPERVVAAAGWFVPQELAFDFYDKQVFLALDVAQLDRLFGVLRRRGVREVLVVSSLQLDGLPLERSRRLDDGLGFMSLQLGRLRLGGGP